MNQLRIAIVGCGRMGTERARAVAALRSRIVYFCDSDPCRATTLAQDFPASMAGSDSGHLDSHSLDAVFICVPPAFRGPVEAWCIRARVPFFVEKPVGLSADHVNSVLTHLQQSPIVHGVGYMNRYRRSVHDARELLRNNEVLGLTCAWVGRKYQVPWWANKELSGGPFNEQGTHIVDLCRYLIGEVEAAASIAHRGNNPADCEFGVAAALKFSNGAAGTLFYSCEALEKDIRLQIFCKEGTLDFEGWDFRITRNTINGHLPKEDSEKIFVKETKAFLDAVRSGDQSIIQCDFAEACRTQRVVDMIRNSFSARSSAAV